MSDSGASRRLPATLDRSALERVLARAAELQSSSSPDAPAELSEEDLIAIGREVGLSTEHMRQALAEERTRVVLPEERGFVARYYGPSTVSAGRAVPGTPEEILSVLDRWVVKEQTLTMKRKYAGRMTWEARGGLEGTLRRLIGGKEIVLIQASEVGATATPMEPGRSFVRLDATVADRRREMVWWSVGIGGLLTLKGAVIATLAWMFPPIGVGIAGTALGGLLIGSGALVAGAFGRGQRRVAERVQVALEQLLDRLEAGEKPTPSLLSVFSQAARR